MISPPSIYILCFFSFLSFSSDFFSLFFSLDFLLKHETAWACRLETRWLHETAWVSVEGRNSMGFCWREKRRGFLFSVWWWLIRWLGCCSGDSVIFGLGFLGFLLKHGVVVVGFSIDFRLGLGFCRLGFLGGGDSVAWG